MDASNGTKGGLMAGSMTLIAAGIALVQTGNNIGLYLVIIGGALGIVYGFLHRAKTQSPIA